MNALLDASAELLNATILLAIVAAPLFFTVLAIDLLIGRRMTPGWRHAMWLLVAVRLVLPVVPESPLALANLWSEGPIAAHPSTAVGSTQTVEITQLTSHSYEKRTYHAPGLDGRLETPGIDWEAVIAMGMLTAWPLGVVWLFARALVSTWRFSWRVRRSPAVIDGRLSGLLDEACRLVGVGRRPEVRLVEGLCSPALFGLLRPTICLPAEAPDELDDEQLRLILTHEAAHLRRGDAWVAWLVTFVSAVHWWNPVAWLATRRIETLRELACDEMVRRSAEEPAWRRYADLLICFASAPPATRLGLVGLWMARPKRKLTERIDALTAEAAERRRMPVALAGPLVLGIALVGMTGAVSRAEGEATRSSTTEWPVYPNPLPKDLDVSVASSEEALFVREYDVSAAVAKLEEMHPEADARACIKLYTSGSKERGNAAEFVDCTPEDDIWRLRTTASHHEMIASCLPGLAASGSWQVIVTTRIGKVPTLETLGDLDWANAIRFPESNAEEDLVEAKSLDEGKGDSFKVTNRTREYTPYLAIVLSEDRAEDVLSRLQQNLRASLMNAPKVTLSNGQQAQVSSESLYPFVTGVNWVNEKPESAGHPTIETIASGFFCKTRPLVVDAASLDLSCRVTQSKITGVANITLPGPHEMTVQSPTTSQQTIDARCRLKQGETLLVAPLTAELKKEGVTCYLISADWFEDVPPAREE